MFSVVNLLSLIGGFVRIRSRYAMLISITSYATTY